MNTYSSQKPEEPIDVTPEVLPLDDESASKTEPSAAQKAKGVAQMAAGAAIGVAGIPLLVLPGPGAVAIVGGAALASKGQRNYSGREASAVEEKIDAAAAKLGEAAKEQAKQTAKAAAQKLLRSHRPLRPRLLK